MNGWILVGVMAAASAALTVMEIIKRRTVERMARELEATRFVTEKLERNVCGAVKRIKDEIAKTDEELIGALAAGVKVKSQAGRRAELAAERGVRRDRVFGRWGESDN
jgi:hypothetical protein